MIEEKKSTHKAEVVKVVLEPHPNAKLLSIVRVFNFQVVVRTADWKRYTSLMGGEMWEQDSIGVYIQPDSVLPESVEGEIPEWSFLGLPIKDPDTGLVTGNEPLREKDRRITVKKLRGIVSQGILLHLPAVATEGGLGVVKIGDDLAEVMGITRYESKSEERHWGKANTSELAKVPDFGPSLSRYDIKHTWYRHGDQFKEGEEVVITEKVDGANVRFVFTGDSLSLVRNREKFYAGSRNLWYKDSITIPVKRTFWEDVFDILLLRKLRGTLPKPEIRLTTNLPRLVSRMYPQIEEFCSHYPNKVVFGEVFGWVQDLRYGMKEKELDFVMFDIYDLEAGEFMDYDKMSCFAEAYYIPLAPVLYHGPYHENTVRLLVDGKTGVGKDLTQIREGVVIRTAEERWDERVGRMCMKAVSDEYLETNGKGK